jgi:double-stranded uracil-DNA glycosylase
MNGPSSKTPPCRCFPPIATADARVLILGSMPSVASLAKRQYYGHPRNAFWAIIGGLFGAGPELPYEDRQRILRERGVAVWDVFRECVRAGSLDASIRASSEMPNDFRAFLLRHRQVGVIFFNGQKAETAFRRHALADIARLRREIRFVRLPSTSPAHAGRTFEQKLLAWRIVKESVNVG